MSIHRIDDGMMIRHPLQMQLTYWTTFEVLDDVVAIDETKQTVQIPGQTRQESHR